MNLKLNATGLNTAEVLTKISEALPQIPFKQTWVNGTGAYLDYAVTEVLPEGQNFVGFVDDHNRRGIILKTSVGNLVIFHRYSDGQQGVVVANNHRNLSALCSLLGYGSAISKQTLFNTVARMGKLEGTWYIDKPGFIRAVDCIASKDED